MALKLKTAAANQALTTAEAKLQLGFDGTERDTEFARLIAAATKLVEHDSDRALINQTWNLYLDAFPAGGDPIVIERIPVGSISSVKYYDGDDALQTWDSANYYTDLNSAPGRILPGSGVAYPATKFARPNAVDVEFVAGYGSASTDVPEEARHAIALLVSHWFEHRDAVGNVGSEIELAYSSLINSLIWRAPIG